MAASQSPTAISACTASLVLPLTPSDRRLEILAQSSAKPSAALASAVANTARLAAR